MALSVTLSQGGMGASVVGNRPMVFIATVTNTNASAVSLLSLSVAESTESDAIISQPIIYAPNTPVNTSNAVIPSGASVSFPFSVVFTNPTMVGASPQNQPGGAVPSDNAYYADPFFTLTAVGQTSDGSVFNTSLLVPVITAGAPPFALGGALQFASGFDFINGLTTCLV